MFEWAKKGGALTEHTRVFGLHLAGWSVPDIADRLGMSQQGVRQSVVLSEKPNSCVRHARRRGEVRLAAKDRRPHYPAYEEARRCREGPTGRTGGEDSVLG
jgi:hypothetical protein